MDAAEAVRRIKVANVQPGQHRASMAYAGKNAAFLIASEAPLPDFETGQLVSMETDCYSLAF